MVALMLAGCSAEVSPSDRLTGCQKAELAGELLDGSVECLADQPVQRYSGFINYEQEAVLFFEAFPDGSLSFDELVEHPWAYLPSDFEQRANGRGLYAVIVRGRRSVEEGAYGHFNLFHHAIDIIAVEKIEKLEAYE